MQSVRRAGPYVAAFHILEATAWFENEGRPEG
jgi:hypothetical protein